MKIACILPTYNGLEEVGRLLNSLDNQTSAFDLYVVDSTSADGTLEFLKSHVDNLTVIPTCEFNHGGTRQMMVNLCSKYDICIFLTQDVYLFDSDSISKIVKPFVDERIGAVCGCQIPHSNANLFARHARIFNYPKSSSIKSLSDVPQLGIKAAFMSNSFAAYRVVALESVDGFPEHLIFAEDMYVAARMLIKGWKIAYSADAVCQHSHNYSVKEEFSRYFDMGVFHAREPWIQNIFGGAKGEGIRYVASELNFLGLKRLYLFPLSLFRNGVKLMGYKLGKLESRLPKFIKRRLGMHKKYWDSSHA